MKKLAISLSALGISIPLFAALPAATDPTVVAVPQLPGGFVVGATAYYMEATPTHGDLDFASVNFGTTSAFFSRLKELDPDFDWGWGVNVGYIFPNTGNDINLSYFQLDTDDRDRVFVNTDAPLFGFITPVFNIVSSAGGVIGPFFYAASKAEYDINQVDLTAGQYIDFGCRLIAHPYAGLRWAEVNRDLDTNFIGTSGVEGSGSTFFATRESSDFDGIGPIVGIDATYYLYMGFGAVGHFDSALLVGDVDTKTDLALATFIPPFPFTVTGITFYQFRADSNNRVVPVLDGKLGLDYTYVFNNCENSDLTLEVGWQVSNYFHVVDRLSTLSSEAGTTTPGFFLFGRRTSNLGIEGPYASLVFHA